MKWHGRLETLGTALVLQLSFFAAALPIVTLAPAALALQHEWTRARNGEAAGIRSFFRSFAVAVRANGILGVGIGILLVMYAASTLFWLSAPSLGAGLAAGALIGLGMAGMTYWLAFVVAGSRQLDRSVRVWFASTRSLFLASLARFCVGGTAAFLTLIVVAVFPPLALVTSGIVPAALADWACRERSPQASRS